MDFHLNDKIVVLTGAGGGLGSEIAICFSRCGSKVALVDIDEEKGKQVSKKISDEGGLTLACRTDVRSRFEVKNMLDQVESEWGVPDILINAAGVINRSHFLEETDEEWDRVMEINLKGTWICSQLISRRMIDSKKTGAIVNFGSVVSEVSDANQVSYAASKGGIRSLTKGMAIALAPYGIRVNAVGPGTLVTDLNRKFLEDNPDIYERRVQRSPLGRLGTPEDVVGGVLYLASDLANFVTGITLYIEAGRLSQNTV
jgi:NAD(P)-dependent dehydrogenase (short-subunit alcohol dehydrogenase family)